MITAKNVEIKDTTSNSNRSNRDNGYLLESPLQIIGALEELKIPTQNWRFKLRDLVESTRNDQVKVYLQSGKLQVVVKVAVVIVRLGFLPFVELYEYGQFFNDGTVLMRGNFNGIGETLKQTENPEDGARRALKEELGQSAPIFTQQRIGNLTKLSDKVMGPMPSEKWPGLEAVYNRQMFECRIWNPRMFRYQYIENKPDKNIIFRWKLSQSNS